MHVEVNQSGKIEQTNLDTALAFTNAEERSILIRARVKRGAQRGLRARGVKPGMIALRMFSAGLFLLLRDHLEVITSVTTDSEYWGHEGEIQSLLLRLIWGENPPFPQEAISFRRTRRSPAHTLPWRTHRGELKPDKEIGVEELLRFC